MPDIATNYFLESLSGGYAWIGGHRDENQTDIFKWTDGTTFSFESWVVGQPNNEEEDSIYMDPAGNWLDGRGTDAKEFICQYKGITKVYGLFSLVCVYQFNHSSENPRECPACAECPDYPDCPLTIPDCPAEPWTEIILSISISLGLAVALLIVVNIIQMIWARNAMAREIIIDDKKYQITYISIIMIKLCRKKRNTSSIKLEQKIMNFAKKRICFCRGLLGLQMKVKYSSVAYIY